jgi:hypothetical protein
LASKFTSDACPITGYPSSQTGIGDCRIASPIYFHVSPRYLIGSGCEFHPPVYVQVCKNVCTYIYLPNHCRQVKLPRLLSVSLLFKKVRSPPWRKRLLLTGTLKSYRPRPFDRTLGFCTSSIQYGKLATPCWEAKSFARFFRDLRTFHGLDTVLNTALGARSDGKY